MAPFPYFGGKSKVVQAVWACLGAPKHYIEPFCGSAAMLLGARVPASLEVIGDANGFIANFWRAVKHQPGRVASWADYPVSHIDLGARHRWLMERRAWLETELQDPDWHGDAKTAGWWLWGQCCWIGSGWCDWTAPPEWASRPLGQVPHLSDAGMGIQAIGKVPHLSDAGRGKLLTSSGLTAWEWLHKLANRLERVRIVHGDWSRCLNHHYGGEDTAIFFDPPYRGFEAPYGAATLVAESVAEWCSQNSNLRIALCGHIGDYDLPGWDAWEWSRGRLTYGGNKTTSQECVWFSPACLQMVARDLFSAADPDIYDRGMKKLFAEPRE